MLTINTKDVLLNNPQEIFEKLRNVGVAVVPLHEISHKQRETALTNTSFYHNANEVFNADYQVKDITIEEKLNPGSIVARKAPDAAGGWIHQYCTHLHILIQMNKTFREHISLLNPGDLKFKPNRIRYGYKKFRNNPSTVHFDGHPFEVKSGKITFAEKPLIATIIAITGTRRFVWWDLKGKDLKPIYDFWVKKGSKSFTFIDPEFMNETYPGCRRLIDVDCSRYPHLILFNECIPHEIADSPSISIFLSPVPSFDKTKITKAKTTSYHPTEFIGLTKHESDKVGICFQMPGFEWPSGKKSYPFCHIRPYVHYKTRIKPRYFQNGKIKMTFMGGDVDQHTEEYKRRLAERGIKLPAFLFKETTPNFVNDIAAFPDIILRDYGFIE